MALNDILKQVAEKDFSGENKNLLGYTEFIKDGKFCIKMTSKFEEATIECSCPDNGLEDEKNYLRLYFLSMVFNAAVHGMKRMKHKKNKK